MPDVIFEELFSDEKTLKHLEEVEKQLIETGKAADKMGEQAATSLNQAAGAAGNFNEQMDTAASQTAKQAKAVEQARNANQSWLQSIKETIAGQQVGGKTLGEWGEQAREFAAKINSGAIATKGLTTATRIFGVALKTLGIGLIIAAIGTLISLLTKAQPIVDRVRAAFEGVKDVFEVLANRAALLFTSLAKLFSGDLIGAVYGTRAAVSGLGGAMVDAAADGYELERQMQKLRDETLKTALAFDRQRAVIEELKKAGNDETKSFKERSAALKEAGDREAQLANARVTRAKQFLDATIKQETKEKARLEELIRSGADEAEISKQRARARVEADLQTQESKDKVIEAERALFEVSKETVESINEIEKEQREVRKQAAAERQKQLNDEAKRAEQLRKEYEKLFADIQKQAEALNIENTFNPVERVIKQYQAAIDETKILRERLLTLAPTDAEKAKVNEAIEKLFDEIAIKYREELDKAETELNELRGGKIREALNPLPPLVTLRRDVADVLRSLRQTADEFIEGQQPKSLLEILGISDASLEQFKDITSQIIDGLNEIADARVKEADAAVDAAERRVNAAQDALIREQELAAQGLANDTNLRKQQLAEAKKAQEEAEKERAKAVRTQILLDGAQQISSLITAAANIFKGFSVLPLAGQVLAIASISAMFAAFAAAKAAAFKAAAIPKFRKGGRLPRISNEDDGMSVTDSAGNPVAKVDGGEWVIPREESNEHDRFLSRMSKGEFEGINLNAYLPKPGGAAILSQSAGSVAQVERERRAIETTNHSALLASVYKQAAGEIVQAIKEQPEIYPLTNYKVRRKRGKTTFTEIVRQEN